MQIHNVQRGQFGNSYHKQSRNDSEILGHVISNREGSQCATSHQQLLAYFHNFNQLCRVVVQIHHITGFLRCLCTAIHRYPYICLCQRRSIIRSVSHHCNQFPGLLLLLDIFHFIFRPSFSNKIIYSSFFSNIFCCQRVVTGHHNRLHTHFAQTFETLLNTRFDNILQFNNAYYFPIDTYHQRCTAIT